MANGAPTVSNGLVITGVTTSTTFSGSGASLTNLNASNIASGTVPTARLGSGTANSSTFLAGDSTFKTVTGTTINNNANNRIISGSNTANTLEGESSFTYDGNGMVDIEGTGAAGIQIKTPNNTDGGIYYRTGSSNPGAVTYQHSDNSMRFRVNSTEKARIASDGDMGVGTASPSTRLHVSGGDGLLVERSSGTSIAGFKHSGATAMNIYFQNSGSTNHPSIGSNNQDLTFGTNNTERLRIGSGGEVSLRRGGISATPSLEIYGSGNAGDAEADNLRIHNWGDSSGDYWKLGVNCGLNASGNSSKPSNTLKGAAVTIDGRYGRVFLQTSPSSSSTVHDALIVNSNGYVNQPIQPSFAAYKEANSFTQSGVIVFDATKHNIGGHYSTSNGRFTAPVAGRYQFTFYSIIKGNYTNAYYSIRKNGSAGRGMYVHISQNIGNIWDNVCTTWILDLNASDYVDINSNSSINWHGYDWQLFSGHLLG